MFLNEILEETLAQIDLKQTNLISGPRDGDAQHLKNGPVSRAHMGRGTGQNAHGPYPIYIYHICITHHIAYTCSVYDQHGYGVGHW